MKSYIFYLSVCGFFQRALLARNPGWGDSPLVVVRDKVVIDASPQARRLGIVPGSPLKLARVLSAGIGRIVHAEEEDFSPEKEAWLDRCARHSGCIEPDHDHAAWLDLSAHPQPEWVACALIDELEECMPLRWGAGRSKWLAQVSAQIEGSRTALLESAELAELGIDLLTPISQENRDRLRFLGCRRVKDLLALSTRVMAEQFGPEAMRIRKAAEGWLVEPVQAVYPPRSLRERAVFEAPVGDQAQLERGIAVLARQAGERLAARCLQGSQVEAVLELEEGEQTRCRSFAKPLLCPSTCLPAFRQIFGEPWPGPVTAIAVRMTELSPTRSVQPSLTEARSAAGARAPKVEAALERLKSLYGGAAIQRAAEVELPRRRLVMKMWEEALGWR